MAYIESHNICELLFIIFYTKKPSNWITAESITFYTPAAGGEKESHILLDRFSIFHSASDAKKNLAQRIGILHHTLHWQSHSLCDKDLSSGSGFTAQQKTRTLFFSYSAPCVKEADNDDDGSKNGTSFDCSAKKLPHNPYWKLLAVALI